MLIREKVKQVFGLLKEFDIDCWITFTRESEINGDPSLIFLAPGPVTWHSAFIFTADGRARAIVGLYDKKTIEDVGAYHEVVSFVTGFKEPFLEYMRTLHPNRIGINYSEGSEICDGLTHGMYLTLQKTLAEIGLAEKLVSAERIVSALRERKTGSEVALIRQAIKQAEAIFDRAEKFIAPGKTEKQIAAFMQGEAERRKLPLAWGDATCPAVFTGPDTAAAHYTPTDRRVARGHLINMDFGVKVGGYCSDLQRTYYVLDAGKTAPPPEVQKGLDTLLRAVVSAKHAIKPGVQGVEVDAVARKILVDGGYEEFPHALGHQVGRYAHDGTAMLGPKWEKYAQKPFQPLEEGMVFTIEPRLTVAGHGVVTIEEMVVVTKHGAEWLSRPETKLRLIGKRSARPAVRRRRK